MAIVNGYATLAELKTYLSVTANTEDSRLESAIEAASRAIDTECRRVFYGTTEVRYVEADTSEYIAFPDDLLSVTEVAIDLGNRNYSALSASDYELEPSIPYQAVYQSPTSTRPFPYGRRGVRITGVWGYSATGSHPDAIRKACLILATRYYKRKDAAFGVIGTPELGYTRINAKDPEVRGLLSTYRRLDILGC